MKQVMPLRKARGPMCTFPQNPWYDQECKGARKARLAVIGQASCTLLQRQQANRKWRRLLSRRKAAWKEQDADNWVELSKGDALKFWRRFRLKQAPACPIQLQEQHHHFENLLGAPTGNSQTPFDHLHHQDAVNPREGDVNAVHT